MTAYRSPNLDSTITKTMSKSDWRFVRIKVFESNTFEYFFDSFSNKKLPESDEMVYSIIGIENGLQIYYYFRLTEGKWFLVRMEDLST